MNKKQLLNAIRKYPHLNDKQCDILAYLILICPNKLDEQCPIYTKISHIAALTHRDVKQVLRAIQKLQKKNIIIELNPRFKFKTYQLNIQELENIIKYTKTEKIIVQKMSKKCPKN